MIIFLDLDGVVINLVKGVADWFKFPIKPEMVIHWDSLPGLVNRHENEFWNDIKKPEFWETLEFYPQAKPFIKQLTYLGKVVLLTNPAHGCAGYRQNWIEHNLPEFFKSGDYILTPAKHHLANKNTILIDDSVRNCLDFHEAGGLALLYNQPWNGDFDTSIETKNNLIINAIYKRGQK